MKKAGIVAIVIVIAATIFLNQNCTGELTGDSAKNSKSGTLDLQFRYSKMYVPVGSNVLALDGTCAASGYPRHRINWQTVINGKAITGSIDNVCNSTSKTFAMNINLASYSLPDGAQFQITGSMVGIDSRGKMTYGKSRGLGIAMVSNGSQATGVVTGSSTGSSGTHTGLDGEATGTSTGEELPPPPPDVCTPGPTLYLTEDLHDAQHLSPNAYIADWPVTSEITSVTQDGSGGICIYHTKLGQWPAVDTFGIGENTTEGNYWFVAGIGDYFTFLFPFHWYRPGQACKSISLTNTGLESGVGGAETPLTYWTPCPGSWVGVVASTPGRMGAQGPIQERSNIYWFQWLYQ